MCVGSLKRYWLLAMILGVEFGASLLAAPGSAIFNVKDYGATGRRSDNAMPALQKAIDACAAAGGGMVYLPPGEYISGQIQLHSHVRFHLEAGATLFASLDSGQYRKTHYAANLWREPRKHQYRRPGNP